MHPVMSITTQPSQQVNTRDNSSKANTTGISFGGVFDAVKRSLDGVMTVASKEQAVEADFLKQKLDIEKAREFKTDLEEAQEILNKIAKVMEKHDKRG